jgi:hypothetical protein
MKTASKILLISNTTTVQEMFKLYAAEAIPTKEGTTQYLHMENAYWTGVQATLELLSAQPDTETTQKKYRESRELMEQYRATLFQTSEVEH